MVTTMRKRSRRAAVAPYGRSAVRWWHWAAAPLVALLAFLDLYAPGFMADLNHWMLSGDYRWMLGLRIALALFCAWAFFGVRSYHVLIGVYLVLVIVGQALRLGDTWAVGEPLSAGTLILLLALFIIPVRVITRPNEADIAAHLEREKQKEGKE